MDAIIFMAALSAYDQPCEDDPRLNRLQDALALFNSIVNHKLFDQTSIILFLNKIDIFQRKLEEGSTQVSKFFPEYRGVNDYFSTTVFFQYRFMQQCKDLQKQVYTHFTHATVSKKKQKKKVPMPRPKQTNKQTKQNKAINRRQQTTQYQEKHNKKKEWGEEDDMELGGWMTNSTLGLG